MANQLKISHQSAAPERPRPTMDGIRQVSRVPRVAYEPVVQARRKAVPLKVRRNRFLRGLEYPVIAIISLVAAFSSTAGQILVLAYGLLVLIFKIDSRGPFAAALFLLVTVPIFQILHLDQFEQNAAIYAYEMLVVGVVAAIIENFRENGAQNGVVGE